MFHIPLDGEAWYKPTRRISAKPAIQLDADSVSIRSYHALRIAVRRAWRLCMELDIPWAQSHPTTTNTSDAATSMSCNSKHKRKFNFKPKYHGPDMWLIDSDSSFDVMSRADLHHSLHSGITTVPDQPLTTANGRIVVNQAVGMHIPSMEVDVKALLLESTPPVLSLGKRIVDDGFSFVWIHGKPPI